MDKSMICEDVFDTPAMDPDFYIDEDLVDTLEFGPNECINPADYEYELVDDPLVELPCDVGIEDTIAQFASAEAATEPFATIATGKQDSDSWPEPKPLRTKSLEVFPHRTLPPVVDRYVGALSTSTQTPVEMASLLALGVLSAALQDKFTVSITPDWQETLSLFCLAVAPPAERKSAVISALTKPLRDHEAMCNQRLATDNDMSEAKRKVLEQKLKKLQSESSSAETDADLDDYVQRIAHLQAQLRQLQVTPYRLLVDDTTPEKLVQIMAQQRGSISICSAEGGLFDALHGRYDRSAGLDVYLKGHAGDAISVDRITRDSNVIDHPHLSVIMTVQPTVLAELMTHEVFRGKGLCARFLFGICQSYIGNRAVSPAPIPADIKADYQALCLRLLSIKEHGFIHLSPAADLLRQVYQAQVEQKLVGEWVHMTDWAGKLVGTMLRIAALIHITEAESNPASAPISENCVHRAIQIAGFLASHAAYAYSLINQDTNLSDAEYLLKRISSAGAAAITKRELYQLCHGRFPNVKSMESGIQLLVEHGYIRVEKKQTGGRPTEVLLLHPSLLQG